MMSRYWDSVDGERAAMAKKEVGKDAHGAGAGAGADAGAGDGASAGASEVDESGDDDEAGETEESEPENGGEGTGPVRKGEVSKRGFFFSRFYIGNIKCNTRLYCEVHFFLSFHVYFLACLYRSSFFPF